METLSTTLEPAEQVESRSKSKSYAEAEEIEKGKLPPEELLSLPMFKVIHFATYLAEKLQSQICELFHKYPILCRTTLPGILLQFCTSRIWPKMSLSRISISYSVIFLSQSNNEILNLNLSSMNN